MSQKKTKRKMTKAQCALVTDKDVVNYIKSIATRFGNKYKSVGYDEFYSVGIAAVCEQAIRYNPQKDASFTTYITIYVNGAMARYVQKYVDGMFIDKQERFFASIFSIEELAWGGEDDNQSICSEELLSSKAIDEEEFQNRIKERVDSILERLTPDECELIAARFGFTDNHGDAVDEYMQKHNIGKTVFYSRAEAAVMKMRKFAQEKNY